MDLGIQGKRALIGASSKGMGKAMALALAQEGVEVFLCARGEEALALAVEEVKAVAIAPVHHTVCDLANPESRTQLIESVRKVFPQLDILIHNVGGPPPSGVEETTLAQWQQAFEQLFLSVVALNQAFVPGMKQQQWGRILCITSIAVLEPIGTLALSNATRSAVTAMLKTLSDELAPYHISVNAIAPGLIHTARTEERIQAALEKSGGTREAHLQSYFQGIPAGRLGTAEEVASLAAFLCSQQAAYITGSTITVDGGRRRSTY